MFKYPNGTCKPILDIYVPKVFHLYKELFNPMSFDACNRPLKIWKSVWTPTSNVRVHLGMWGSFLHIFYIRGSMKCDSQASLLAHTFASPCINHDSKAKIMIRYGSYEILMMPFELCNASTTFTTFVTSILHEKLDEFMIIYINDILVYFKTT